MLSFPLFGSDNSDGGKHQHSSTHCDNRPYALFRRICFPDWLHECGFRRFGRFRRGDRPESVVHKAHQIVGKLAALLLLLGG